MCFRIPGYYIRHQVRTQRVKLPNGIEVQNPNIMHCCCDPWWEWPQRQTRALLVRTDDFWYEWEAAACGIAPVVNTKRWESIWKRGIANANSRNAEERRTEEQNNEKSAVKAGKATPVGERITKKVGTPVAEFSSF